MSSRLGWVVVPLLVLACGCGVLGGADEERADGSSAPAPSSPSPTAPAPDDEELAPPAVPEEDPPPCAAVRAGIDAFNGGDPEETVSLFEDALPLAEQYAVDEPGRTAELLLAAVEYYVALPPDDYASALASSPDFRRHQIVTLAVCRYGTAPGSEQPTEDAVPA